jgi:arylsulfatase A-like enzyme
MLSGVLPEVHGNIPGNGGSLYTGPTLAEIAGKSGLATGAFIGGITLQDSMCGLSRGFDHYDDDFAFHTADTRPGAQVTASAIRWIEDQTGPYFAFVHLFDAHSPYTPVAPWDTRYDPDYTGDVTGSLADLGIHGGGSGRPMKARDLAHVMALYDGELSQLDSLLGRLLATAGPKAVVVITSDHGESFEHGYYFNHRAALWDSVLRVPWLVRGPGVPSGLVIEDPVSLIDLTPTVLALAGLPTDTRMQGESRVPLLLGTGGGAELHYALTDPWMPDPQFAVRTATTKVIWQTDGTQVYNLATDPQERTATADVPPDLMDARDRYNTLVDSLSKHQTQAPMQSRFTSPEESERLKALGYVDPNRPPANGPPGPPPNGPVVAPKSEHH